MTRSVLNCPFPGHHARSKEIPGRNRLVGKCLLQIFDKIIACNATIPQMGLLTSGGVQPQSKYLGVPLTSCIT